MIRNKDPQCTSPWPVATAGLDPTLGQLIVGPPRAKAQHGGTLLDNDEISEKLKRGVAATVEGDLAKYGIEVASK
jgi:hypothetical protein